MADRDTGDHGLSAPRRDPLRQSPRPGPRPGPGRPPAVSRRAPIWADVPDERWNDWRWQMSNRVNTVEEIGRVLNLTDDERAGLSTPDKFRVDITPYFLSLIDPDDPNDPIRRQVIPTDCEHEAFTAMMEDSLAEDRHSPVPGLVHRYPDRVLMLVTTQCASYCRYCTRIAHRRRRRARTSTAPSTRPSSTTCAAPRRSATCSSPAATR